MDRSSSRTRTALLLAAVALAIGLWLARSEAPMAPAAPPSSVATPDAAEASTTPAVELAEHSHRIGEHGRLTLEADTLPVDGTLALALDLPDEARGSEPRPVVIACTDGRRLETQAAIPAGPGTGVHLEVDPSWLEPGVCMISVTTAEPSHFPFRRYVLEIR